MDCSFAMLYKKRSRDSPFRKNLSTIPNVDDFGAINAIFCTNNSEIKQAGGASTYWYTLPCKI